MGFKNLYRSLMALCLVTGAASTHAASIGTMAYGDYGVNPSFSGLCGGDCVLDGVLRIGSAQFGERFSGQGLGASGDADLLSGTPTGPLSLLSGALGQNLMKVPYGGGDTLAGLGWQGVVDGVALDEAIGEGAISILFDGDQSKVGFNVDGWDGGGSLFVQFFDINGKSLRLFEIADLSSGTALGFAAMNNQEQIAPLIAGMSIWNTDPGGLGISGLTYDVDARRGPGGNVPEPSALLLAGLGLAAVVARRRR